MNISFKQLIILIMLGLLFFGDISNIVSNTNNTLNNIKSFFNKKNKKKGI